MKKFVTLTCIVCLWALSSLGFAAEQDLHEDVLNSNPALSLSQVLDKTVSRNPQQYQLSAEAYGVSKRQAMAQSWLPNAPAISFYHQND